MAINILHIFFCILPLLDATYHSFSVALRQEALFPLLLADYLAGTCIFAGLINLVLVNVSAPLAPLMFNSWAYHTVQAYRLLPIFAVLARDHRLAIVFNEMRFTAWRELWPLYLGTLTVLVFTILRACETCAKSSPRLHQ